MQEGNTASHPPIDDVLTLHALAARLKALEDADLDKRLKHVEQLNLQIRTVVLTVLVMVVAFGIGAKEMLKALWAGVGP